MKLLLHLTAQVPYASRKLHPWLVYSPNPLPKLLFLPFQGGEREGRNLACLPSPPSLHLTAEDRGGSQVARQLQRFNHNFLLRCPNHKLHNTKIDRRIVFGKAARAEFANSVIFVRYNKISLTRSLFLKVRMLFPIWGWNHFFWHPSMHTHILCGGHLLASVPLPSFYWLLSKF